MPPTPRADVYDLYWQFIAKRQAVFERRAAGLPAPWSDDPILQQYKFCNVYRAADRVSQFLLKEVAYAPGEAREVLFRVLAFRCFSKIETWRGVVRQLGRAPVIDDLRTEAFLQALEAVKAREGTLYTGAFILCASNAFGQPSKHANHCALFKNMFVQEGLAERLLAAKSLREVYEMLIAYPLIGPFMAYQIAIDLNYTPLINFSENDFTQPGPGALRGLKKIFVSLGGLTPADAVLWLTQRQGEEFVRLGLDFKGLYGRPMQAIDVQNCLCEVDKYCRVARPELASNRTRIKTQFSPTVAPIEYFWPPKWGVKVIQGRT